MGVGSTSRRPCRGRQTADGGSGARWALGAVVRARTLRKFGRRGWPIVHDVNARTLPARLTSPTTSPPSGPDADSWRRAALRSHCGKPRADRRPPPNASTTRARRPAAGARRRWTGHGDPSADRSPARPAPLRPGPVPRTHGAQTTPSPSTSDDSASPTARSVVAAGTGAPPRPSRSSARPTPTRWAWRAVAGTAGRAAGSATTGTRSSLWMAWRAAPRSTTSPPSSPASAATARPGCEWCSAPSMRTRTPSSAQVPRRPGRRRWSGHGGRPSSPCTAPPTCSTPTPTSATAGAGCCSSVQPDLAYVSDVPSLGEEGCRPVRCATWSRRGPGSGGDRPGCGPPEVFRGPGEGD